MISEILALFNYMNAEVLEHTLVYVLILSAKLQFGDINMLLEYCQRTLSNKHLISSFSMEYFRASTKRHQ
jgi:hypothetical protein